MKDTFLYIPKKRFLDLCELMLYVFHMKFEFPDEDIEVLKSKDCEEPIPEEGPDPESERILMSDGGRLMWMG